MYAFATDGTRDNNNEFSPCSRRMMDGIIRSRGQSSGRGLPYFVFTLTIVSSLPPSLSGDGCFVDAGDLCQNGLVDEGEDCDCGTDYDESTKLCNSDMCCNGSNCTLAPSIQCR